MKRTPKFLFFLVAALVTAQLPAAAQPVATAEYIYLLAQDTLATEKLEITAGSWVGVLNWKGQPAIKWTQSLNTSAAGTTAAPGNYKLEVFAAGAPATGTPLQHALFRQSGDTIIVDMASGGATDTQKVPSAPGAYVVFNQSLTNIITAATRAVPTGAGTFHVLLAQGGQRLPVTVRRSSDTVSATMGGVEMLAVFDSRGLISEIRVPSQALTVLRKGATAPAAPAPADYSAPSDAPYSALNVTIPTDRGYNLAATLTSSSSNERQPVAITISGSGLQDRDSRILTVPDYAPFREIADTLGRRGIAVLRFDDRGFGGSGGRETLTSATSADFADDVRSIVSWLKSRPDIDPARIYLIGHSEGGMIAPMVAAANPDIRAIVLLAGSAQNGRQILMYQNEQLLKAAGLPDRARDSIMATVPAQLDSLAKANAWMGFFMSHDPIATIKRVQQPVLIMQGETDQQVTPGQADLLAAALTSAGNNNVTTRKFASVNHLFLSDPSGAPQGYATLSNKKLPKTVLGTIADWLATNAGTTPRVQRLF